MNDEPMQPLLERWFEDTDPQPPDARQTAAQVVAQVPRTRQRGRWLPFPLFQRRVQTPTATDTADYQPTPIPATNSQTPTVTGRTQSMFSPAKAITAGALVFAIGGVLLIAQPFDQQGGVPGAATDPANSAFFTADVRLTGTFDESSTRNDDGTRHYREDFQMAVDASDSRASGTLTYGLNRTFYAPGVQAHAGTVTLENDDGMWEGAFTGYWTNDGDRILHAQLSGQDAYEGWTMLLDESFDNPTYTSVMRGVIFPGGLPEAK